MIVFRVRQIRLYEQKLAVVTAGCFGVLSALAKELENMCTHNVNQQAVLLQAR